MTKVVDARGLACPQPVVLTSKAIQDADRVTVIVDNVAAVENVTRFARSKGFGAEKTEKPDGIYLALRREGSPDRTANPEPVFVCSSTPGGGPTVLFVSSDSLGRGPAELGERLMAAFFHTLLELDPKPQTIIFINAGVKLAVKGSKALEDIRALEALGIEILACGTCLGFFELTDQLGVGKISNMYDIGGALLNAGKIIEL